MTEAQKDHKRLLENLRLLQKIHGASALADALGISKNTWTNRMREPWKKFSYDDFRLLSAYCHINLDSLMLGEVTLR
jgi:hypothetical protein